MTAIVPAFVAGVLHGARVDLSTEKAAQAEVAAVLVRALPGVTVEREARLSDKDVVDVLVGGEVAVEVKLREHGKMAVFRQLRRYARHERVRALVLVTNQAMGLPAEIEGKPAFYVSLGRGWL